MRLLMGRVRYRMLTVGGPKYRAFCLALLLLAGWGYARGSDEAAGPAVWQVADFGAVPDDGQDDTVAFHRAAEALMKSPGAILELDAGTYRLGVENSPQPGAVTFRDLDRVTIRGRGANATRLLITSPRHGGLHFISCRDTRVERLCIDYDPLPFTQGRALVVNRDDGWFDFAVDPGFPALSEPWFADAPKPYGQWGMIFERDAPLLKRGAPDHLMLKTWRQIARSVWRVWVEPEYKTALNALKPGDRFVHLARHGRGAAVLFQHCRGGGAYNVTICASPSLAVCMVGGGPVTCEGVIVTVPADSGRLISTDADGVHCQQMEIGPRILNCVFRYMADDAVNIYYYPGRVVDRLSDSVLVADARNEIRANDRLIFFDEQAGAVTGEAVVSAVEQVPGGDGAPRLRVVLDRPVPAVRPRGLPEKGDAVYNMSRCGSGFEIRGNLMAAHRRYGLMLKAPDGLVENNLLDQLGGCGIVIGNDPFWPEGVLPSRIRIAGNILRDCGRSAHYGVSPWGAAIQIGTWSLAGPARDRACGVFTLNNNRVLNPMGSAVSLTSVEDVSIDTLGIIQSPQAVPPREAPLIRIENADLIDIRNVTASAPRPEVTALVETFDSCGPDIAVTDMRAALPPGVPLWRDSRSGRRP